MPKELPPRKEKNLGGLMTDLGLSLNLFHIFPGQTNMGRQPGKICVTLSLPKRILASLQLFCEFTYNNLSSTNSTLCAQPCYCQTVETHSCVSASCQVFATGDFIRQSCLLRRKNASLQVFTEFTYNRIVKRASKRSNKSSVETWRAAPPLTRTEQTRECPSPAKRWTFP